MMLLALIGTVVTMLARLQLFYYIVRADPELEMRRRFMLCIDEYDLMSSMRC